MKRAESGKMRGAYRLGLSACVLYTHFIISFVFIYIELLTYCSVFLRWY